MKGVLAAKSIIESMYSDLKKKCKNDWGSQEVSNALICIAVKSLKFLESIAVPQELLSQVKEKTYFTYSIDKTYARPANKAFFLRDHNTLKSLWKQWDSGELYKEEFNNMIYTIALAPCLAMELFDRQNKKGPATYFECLIGFLFSRKLGVNPTQRAALQILDESVTFTMDFLFDLGTEKQKLHVPVKMSTRERVVQAWAHQRLLDSAFEIGTYKGVMILFAETKLDSRTHQVVEICVPDQWLAYQSLLAKMDSIYYFDIPLRYYELTTKYPDIFQIKPIKDFLTQTGHL